jgi:hypothetical protein
VATEVTVFRAAGFGSPLRIEPSRSPGRFHRVGTALPTQYTCDHPLGPYAEKIRAEDLHAIEDVRELQVRTWVLRVEIDGFVKIGFENAEDYGILPADLVSDDLSSCQGLADRQRNQGAAGLIVPSAALPGTRCIVIFGERVASTFLGPPMDPLLEIPASMTSDPGRSPISLLPRVRFRGQPHAGLDAWVSGTGHVPVEPDWTFP